MLELITKKISNKIILALFILMSFSSLTIIFVTTSKVTENSIVKTKENLEMLNAAMFQSLRNAMSTGDPVQIANAEENARQRAVHKKLGALGFPVSVIDTTEKLNNFINEIR